MAQRTRKTDFHIASAIFGRYPGKTINRLGAALFGIWLSSIALDIIWPTPDQIDNSINRSSSDITSLINKTHPISIIFIIKSNQMNFRDNTKESKSLHIDLFLIETGVTGNITITSIPSETKLLSSMDGGRTLKDAYKKGGVALIAGILNEAEEFNYNQNTRYLIIEKAIIKRAIEKILSTETLAIYLNNGNVHKDSLILNSSNKKIKADEEVQVQTINSKAELLVSQIYNNLHRNKIKGYGASIIFESMDLAETNLTPQEVTNILNHSLKRDSSIEFIEFR